MWLGKKRNDLCKEHNEKMNAKAKPSHTDQSLRLHESGQKKKKKRKKKVKQREFTLTSVFTPAAQMLFYDLKATFIKNVCITK